MTQPLQPPEDPQEPWKPPVPPPPPAAAPPPPPPAGGTPYYEPPTGSYGAVGPGGPGGYGAPPGPPPPPPAGYGPAGYGPSAYGPPPPPTTSNDALVSLITGILSYIACPVILAIVAIVYGGRAKREIAVSGGLVGGRGMATAGVILGWVNLVLSLLLIVLWVILLVAFSSSGY